MGDEHSVTSLCRSGHRPKLGDLVRLVAPHCDPTLNLHSQIHIVQDGRLVDIWPIEARGYQPASAKDTTSSEGRRRRGTMSTAIVTGAGTGIGTAAAKSSPPADGTWRWSAADQGYSIRSQRI